MTSELIIEHKVSCAWLRSRDTTIFLASWLLWSTMLATLPEAQFTGVSASSYGAMMIVIGAMFFAWSRLSLIYFHYSTLAAPRRVDTVLRSDALAIHFGVDVQRLTAMQREQRLVIFHSSAGQIVDIVCADAAGAQDSQSQNNQSHNQSGDNHSKDKYSRAA